MRGRCWRVRLGKSRRHLHLRKAGCRSYQRISRSAHDLLTPCVEQPAADTILPRHLGRREVWPQALQHDVALLLPCPSPARLAADKDLDRRATSTPMTYRTRTLRVGGRYRRWRNLVHAWLRSHRHPAPQCAAATALTSQSARSSDLVRQQTGSRRLWRGNATAIAAQRRRLPTPWACSSDARTS